MKSVYEMIFREKVNFFLTQNTELTEKVALLEKEREADKEYSLSPLVYLEILNPI